MSNNPQNEPIKSDFIKKIFLFLGICIGSKFSVKFAMLTSTKITKQMHNCVSVIDISVYSVKFKVEN